MRNRWPMFFMAMSLVVSAGAWYLLVNQSSKDNAKAHSCCPTSDAKK